MKKQFILRLISNVFILSILISCSKSENKTENNTAKVFDNTINGLWKITKVNGNTISRFIYPNNYKTYLKVNDTLLVRKDKYNSGYFIELGGSTKIIAVTDNSLTFDIDNGWSFTNWNLEKVSPSIFRLTGLTSGSTGSFEIEKIQDAPECPFTGFKQITKTHFTYEHNIWLSGIETNLYYTGNEGEIIIPPTLPKPPPNDNSLKEGDYLRYVNYSLNCPTHSFIYKSGEWVKE